MQRKIMMLIVSLWMLGLVASGSEGQPPAGFTALFNGKDFSNWKVPQGDNGHWKVMDGVIDYDAESEATGDKSLWSEKEFGDFVLQVDWRIKETPYVNPNVPYILPDGTHARDTKGKEMHMALPDSTGNFVLVNDLGLDATIVYSFDAGTGRLTEVNRIASAAGAGPRHLAWHPNGKVVYNYQSLNPSRHVEKTLTALKEFTAQAKARQ